jgi:hypothetical protein
VYNTEDYGSFFLRQLSQNEATATRKSGTIKKEIANFDKFNRQ